MIVDSDVRIGIVFRVRLGLRRACVMHASGIRLVVLTREPHKAQPVAAVCSKVELRGYRGYRVLGCVMLAMVAEKCRITIVGPTIRGKLGLIG
jgi:hypothetical protein